MNKNLLVKNILIAYLYISFKTPIFFLLAGLPMILFMQGFSPTAIGLFQLASIPYITAFLFAPIVDGFVFKNNHYKTWVFIYFAVYISLLFSISFFSLKDDYYLLFTLILLTVFSATLLTTPLNALATKIFTKQEQISAGGFKSSAYFTSSLIGNGVMLLIYNSYGWKYTIFAMILLLLPSLVILYILKEPNSTVEKEGIQYKQIIEFFKQKDMLKWIFILLTYFIFLSPLWIFLKPYLLSKGIDANHVAIIAGIYGSFVAVIGSLGVSFFAKKFDIKLLLFIFALLSVFSIGLFLVLDLLHLSLPFIIICVTFLTLSKGLSGSIVFAIIMNKCRVDYKAIDYSIQASIYAFGGIFAGMMSGIILESFSYKVLFVITLCGMVMVSVFAYRYFKNSF